MDHAARDLMEEYPDIILAFGESDEFRLVIGTRLQVAFPCTSFTTVSSSENLLPSTTDANPKSFPH